MANVLDIFQDGFRELALEESKNELRVCNDISRRYGLTLNEEEIAELLECRTKALKHSGRVEFGGGILPKLIYAFCDSSFMEQDSYEETLVELQEAFYYFKSECLDAYSDDELIEYMVAVFNGRAQGSAEYLIQTSLDDLCRYTRCGYDDRDVDEVGDLF